MKIIRIFLCFFFFFFFGGGGGGGGGGDKIFSIFEKAYFRNVFFFLSMTCLSSFIYRLC